MSRRSISALALSFAIGASGLSGSPASAEDAGRCACDSVAASPEDAAFQHIYQTEWTWREAQHLVDEDDDKIEPDLPDVGARAQAARLAYWTRVMGDLDRIAPKTLSVKAQLNYAVYKPQIQSLINEERFRQYEMPVNGDSAFWSDLAGIAETPFKNRTDYENFLSLMTELPRYFLQQEDNMRAGEARGFTPPKVTLEGRDQAIRSVAEAKSPDDTPYFKPFKSFPSAISPAEQAALQAQARAVIAAKVIPAYAGLLRVFDDDYVPHARTTLAAEELPDGKAYYQSQILEYTTTELTPDQIHQIGLQQIAKIRAEMLATMQASGFKGTLPQFLHFLRTDPQFYAKTPSELLKDAAWIAKTFDGKASSWFGYLPRARFAIRPVPADIAPFYTSGRGGPGVYLVNTYDLPSRPLYALTALTLHESAPGHAFQIPIAEERKDLPPFRREYISAYGEGWAVYCERLGQEMGMYETPYDTFGMLSYQAWRAARLVVDTGLHSQGWTRAQAVAYLSENTALSDHEVQTETDRYISWPGQALSYYLGEMAIFDARHRAEAALGSKFNIRAFHDDVLETGSVPLPALQQHVDAFIARGGVGPYPDMEK